MKIKLINTRIKKIRLICIIVFVLGVFLVSYGAIIKNSDYSFKMSFNDEEIGFFEGETLHFLNDVNIVFEGDKFKVLVSGKKKDSSFSLKETSNITLKKHLYSINIPIEIDNNPLFYLVDEDGNEIHNYLSNNKAFKIISDEVLYVNNVIYNGEMFTEVGNYFITYEEKDYNVNILNY